MNTQTSLESKMEVNRANARIRVDICDALVRELELAHIYAGVWQDRYPTLSTSDCGVTVHILVRVNGAGEISNWNVTCDEDEAGQTYADYTQWYQFVVYPDSGWEVHGAIVQEAIDLLMRDTQLDILSA